MSFVYVDTNVLVKRYLPEETSDDVDEFFDRPEHRFALSELCLVELESVLARRAREPGGQKLKLAEIRMRFENDLRSGFFEMHSITSAVLMQARQLISDRTAPLATLDALHLSTALEISADVLATNDKQLARATRAYGLTAISFF
jgi:predicted nucleic acid-binding protein